MSTAAVLPIPPTQLRELAARALVGTDRSGGTPSAAGELLSQAAKAGLKARAGLRPKQISDHLPPCSPETRSVASAQAMSFLQRLLADPEASLIQEWAELADAQGKCVSEPLVPVLLDWWSRQPQRADVVFAVTGKCGEWLASLNPAWQR